MPKFQVEIEEILQRVEEIEAKDLEEALEIVEEKYDKNEIELDYEDFKGHEVREYRPNVMEEDLVQNAIFNINCGRAILLEGNKDTALIKRLDVRDDISPYIIVNNLKVNKYQTGFEWDHGKYFESLAVASEEYEKNKKQNEYNDLIYSEVGEWTLGSYNITRFNDLDEIFRFLFDDEINKETLVDMLSENVKREIVLSQLDVVIEEDGKFYYGEDFYFFEEEINEKTRKIDKILNELNIKNVKPYDVIELLEQSEAESINKNLENNIASAIKEAGYEKSISDFINYINEEIEKEASEKVEEVEEEEL